MQLTDKSIIIDFYPDTFIVEEESKIKVKRFVKKVKFLSTDGNHYDSYSTCSASDMRNEVQQRIANGFKVTDFHIEMFNDYKNYNPMWGAC